MGWKDAPEVAAAPKWASAPEVSAEQPASPRQKMAAALGRLIPAIPGETPEEHQQNAGQAMGLGMGMSMPNPVSALRGLLPKAAGDVGAALDPVMQQPSALRRMLPQAVDLVMHPKATAEKLLRKAVQAPEPVNPYPVPQAPAGAPAPPAAAPVAVPEPIPTPPAAAPAGPPTTAQIFELAGRGRKVSELAKTIDANAKMHLGVDPMDPRFADALESLPQEWWDGIAQVAKINKPSPATVKEAVSFFRDRASRAGK